MNKIAPYISLVIALCCLTPEVQADNTQQSEPTKPVTLSVAEQRKFDYFFYEGINLKSADKFDAAFDAFNHAYSIDSTASAVLYELANYYLQLGRQEKTIHLLEQAVKYSPENFTYKMGLATIARNVGVFGQAVETLEELVKEYPAKIELNFYLADALTQQGEISKAIESYDALESAMGMNEAISMEKYRLYMMIEEKDKAFGEIQKLADKYPMDSRYQIRLGDLYLENKDYDNALASYKKAHEINPDDPYYIVSMANYYEATGNREGAEAEIKAALVNENLDVDVKVSILSRYIVRLQQTQQGTESANALFTTLLEQHPEDTELKIMYGSLLMMQNNDEDARFQFQLVTEMEPENQPAWQQLLSLAMRANDVDEMIRICNKCIELFPDTPEYYFYLGIGHYQKEEYQEALDIYYKGIEVIGDSNPMMKSDLYGQVGDIYYQLKQMDKAYEAYEEALKYNERNISVLNNYSYFLALDRIELKKAERMSAQTIRMEPDNSTYLDTYAWIFFMQGDYSLAKIYIERAISNDKTNSTELIDHYGDILYMMGDKEKALIQWEKAREMGKESEVLDRKIRDKTYYEEENN